MATVVIIITFGFSGQLENIYIGKNVELTAMKYHKNTCGEQEGLHSSFEGSLHLFLIVYVSERLSS